MVARMFLYMSNFNNDYNETVRRYYKELSKFKPITKEEESKLFKEAKEGNLDARNEIIERNLKFVFDIARKFRGRGVCTADLISDGNLGLMKAIDKFDVDRDVKFITYAIWWIRQSILEGIKKRQKINLIEEMESSSIKEWDEDSSNDVYDTYENFDNGYEPIVIDEDSYIDKSYVTSRLLESLNENERRVIESYFGLNDGKCMNFVEIGKILNVTSERSRKIAKKALFKMRSSALAMDDVDF